MKGFLRSKATEIGSLTSIFLVVIGIVGFGVTICQLVATQNSLMASNAYQIQRDARSLIERVSEDGRIRKMVNGAELTAEDLVEVRSHLWQMFNFYLSVYRQERANGIAESFSSAFRSDFCGFVRHKSVSDMWGEMEETGMITENHSEMKGVWCDKVIEKI